MAGAIDLHPTATGRCRPVMVDVIRAVWGIQVRIQRRNGEVAPWPDGTGPGLKAALQCSKDINGARA